MEKNLKSIPVFFEQGKSIADQRFRSVKIYVAHVGLNRNYSDFSRQALVNMYSTISNIPIVGYLDHGDFEGHETSVTITRDNVEYTYLGHAYGFIPEQTGEPQFEMRIGEDGVEREYLTVEGIMWEKWGQAIDAFGDSNGVKSQSMEIVDFEGTYDENGIFHYTNATFDALCILGDHVTPAMVSSTIEMFSGQEGIKQEIHEMLSEFSAYYNELKGGENVPGINENVEPVVEDVTVDHSAEESTVEPVIEDVVEDTTVEPTANHSADESTEEPVVEDTVEDATEESTEPNTDHSVEDPAPTTDESNTEEFETLKAQYDAVVGQLADVTAEFEAAKAELEELRPIKAEKERADKEAKLAEYSKALTEEEYEALKEKLDTFSVDQIKGAVGEMLVARIENGSFSATEPEKSESPKVKAKKSSKTSNDDAENPYGKWASFAKE